MPFERYEILLPLKYNDGTPVEPEKFLVITDSVDTVDNRSSTPK